MKHLKEQNISYIDHLIRGVGFVRWSIRMCIVCLIHAVFPFWHENTFSKEVNKLSSKLKHIDTKIIKD